MTGIQRPSPHDRAKRRPADRIGARWRGLALARIVALAALAALAAVAPGARAGLAAETPAPIDAGLRIAIAPFVGEEGGDAISQLLAARVGRLGVARLLAPGSFVADREFDPRAASVRTWAYQAAVDTLIVGRVERPGDEVQQIEAVARSGHSGAELFRHAIFVPERAGLGAALDLLAAAIVRDLGGDPIAASADADGLATPAVSANASDAPIAEAASAPAQAAAEAPDVPHAHAANGEAGAAKPSADASAGAPARAKATATPTPPAAGASGAGTAKKDPVASRLGGAGFDGDAPIEIQAEEAEILAQGDDRKLVFQGGVHVRQDNVSVESDRLEADYEEGESEPSRLLALGKVHVGQGNRSARCDRAEYFRATQKLTCRGHAELIQGCDVVRGELIELDLANEKARVEGAASIVINPKRNADAACATPGRAKTAAPAAPASRPAPAAPLAPPAPVKRPAGESEARP